MAFNQDANEFHWLMDMLESVEVGLVVLDLDFHVQAWNGFMEHHSGITASQIQDKVLFEAFPDIPEAWLTRKVDAVAMLNTRPLRPGNSALTCSSSGIHARSRALKNTCSRT